MHESSTLAGCVSVSAPVGVHSRVVPSGEETSGHLTMGKYSHIASRLTPKPEESPFQTEVTALKRTIIDQGLSESDLAKFIVEVREEKASAKKIIDEINMRLTAYEQILTDKFEQAGITQVRLETGETISTQIKPYARVADKLSFRTWCGENGYEESLALPWQTTNSIVADRLIEGLPEPDGIETYKQTTVVMRKGRP